MDENIMTKSNFTQWFHKTNKHLSPQAIEHTHHTHTHTHTHTPR